MQGTITGVMREETFQDMCNPMHNYFTETQTFHIDCLPFS